MTQLDRIEKMLKLLCKRTEPVTQKNIEARRTRLESAIKPIDLRGEYQKISDLAALQQIKSDLALTASRLISPRGPNA